MINTQDARKIVTYCYDHDEISKRLAGKIIERFEHDADLLPEFIEVHFKDGSILHMAANAVDFPTIGFYLEENSTI